jgi:elongation factor P--(R)-beta-lysine ligase
MILYSLMRTWQHIKNDPKILERYLIRERVIDTIRKFFKDRQFHEVFTPIMVPVPSIEPNLEVFETELRTSKGIKKRAFLISSPEYAIKRLLAAGVGNTFEITKSFRNEEEVSKLHSPEFTILEWYRVNANYFDIMNDFEDLFLSIIGKNELNYQGEVYDLTKPWPRITFVEAFKKYADKNLEDVKDEDFYKTFFNEVEPKILASRKPIFLYDYPISQASLARPKKEDLRYAERFEVFIAGVELGNCFSELTDANLQHKRFEADLAERKAKGKTDFPIDEDFIDALKSGMPESSGIAVGVDRLIMLAADVPTVSDTIFFPDNEIFDI